MSWYKFVQDSTRERKFVRLPLSLYLLVHLCNSLDIGTICEVRSHNQGHLGEVDAVVHIPLANLCHFNHFLSCTLGGFKRASAGQRER